MTKTYSKPHLVTGTSVSGEPAYFIISIEAAKIPEFKKAQKSPFLDLRNFGKILFSGTGECSLEKVMSLLKEKK